MDNSGAVLPGATVTATNTATAVARTTISDGQGRYSIADLPPGAVRCQRSRCRGFRRFSIAAFAWSSATRASWISRLGISGVAETVTVSGAAPVVDTVSTAIGTVVEQKQMAELPLARSQLFAADRARAGRQRSAAGDGRRPVSAVLRPPAAIHRVRRAAGRAGLPVGQHQRAELLESRQRIRAARDDARRGGHRRIPGAHQHVQRAVRRQRRRDQRHHQVGHESVSRIAVRVLPRRRARRVELLRSIAGPARSDAAGRISSA